MNKIVWSKRYLRYFGIPLVFLLAIYILWDAAGNFGGQDICAGISLILALAGMIYLKRLESTAKQNLTRRIRAEFSPEDQTEVFKIYDHLKTKELEGLFQKVFDDAHGNLTELRKIATLAENIGWEEFLENRY